LKIVFDDYAYPLKCFWNFWREFESQGDEIGWHPHLWRWSEQRRCWYQEIHDERWMSTCLEKGHSEFLKLAKDLTSMRSGWSFHSNFTIRKVNDLGLLTDLSALPGLKHSGCADERGSHFINEYDWSITKDKPYFPSERDYRRPRKGDERSLEILEIPITTAPKGGCRLFVEEVLRLTPMRGQCFSREAQNRYEANITSSSFKRLAKQKLKEAKRSQANLVTVFHPVELFQPKRLSNLVNNLRALKGFSRSMKIPFLFLTAKEMAKGFLCSHNAGLQLHR